MKRHGFTLLELAIVLAIVALTTTLVVPQLRDPRARILSITARQLADTLSLARDRAILRSRPTAIVFDLDTHRWRTDDAGDRPVALPPDVRLSRITIGGRAAITDGQVTLALQPAGDLLPTTIDLRDDRGRAARVVLPPARARALVLPQERS